MSGETHLTTLLRTLQPVLQPTHYVFCTVHNAQYGDLPQTRPIACMMEAEGLTLVVSQEDANREGLTYEGTFQCIRLDVHSSLHAVGLTATVSTVLAQQGISANMVAGYYHDHIFVPSDDADRALQKLQSLNPLHAKH